MHPFFPVLKVLFFPLLLLGKFVKLVIGYGSESQASQETGSEEIKNIPENPENIDIKFLQKLSSEAYEVDVTLLCAGEDELEVRSAIREIASTLSVYTQF